MPTSFAQTAQPTCPQCHQLFQVDVWLIVDVDARPDLLAQIQSETIHDLSCPHCGDEGAIDAPLLILRRAGGTTDDGRPTPEPALQLIFSPAQGTSTEQNQQVAGQLLGMLAQEMGDAWRDEWLANVQTMPRQLLPALLSDDPEAGMRQMRAQMEAAMERMRQEDPETFAQIEAAARAAEKANETADPAPSPQPGGPGRGETPPAIQAILDELAAEGIQIRSNEDMQRVVAQRPDIAQRLEEAMRQSMPLVNLIDQFVRASSWDESKRIVQNNPDLLTDQADALLTELAEGQETEQARRMLTDRRNLLRRCRSDGIDAAFASRTSPSPQRGGPGEG